MTDPLTARDELENNLLAAGALLAVLRPGVPDALVSVEPVVDEHGNPTNQLDLELSFMTSPYRITVERVRTPVPEATDNLEFGHE